MASFSESSGSSSGSSQSTSEPVPVNTPQSDWGLMQSQLLSLLADKTYQWAMNQYAKGEGVSDQTIANFLEMSGKGKGLADTLLTQYRDQMKPLMDQYIREAGSYASEGRQRFMAGRAMSTTAQAGKAAMDATQRKLEGYGVDPNAGEYKDMLLSSRMQDAAARAGAGTQAALDTADRGRAMLTQAINWGQQMPGQAVNAIQSAYAGLTGAENAILGLLNTGVNLAQAASPYENASVAANKLPPVGQNAQSSSQQSSQQRSQSEHTDPERQQREQQQRQPGQGGGGGRGGGEGGGGPGSAYPPNYGGGDGTEGTGTPYSMDMPTPGYFGPVGYVDENGMMMPEWSPGTGYGSFEDAQARGGAPNWVLPDRPGSEGYNVGPGGIPENTPMQPGFFPSDYDQGQDWENPSGPAPSGPAMVGGSQQDFANYDGGDFEVPENAQYTGGQNFDLANYDPYGGQDFNNYDTPYEDYSQYAGGEDTYGGGYEDYGGGYEDTSYGNEDYGGDYEDYGGGYEDTSYGSEDYGGGYEDYGGGYEDTSYSGGEDYSGYDEGGGYEEYYARGGRVRPPMRRPRPGVLPTSGGAVPRNASPSRGRQTDDISARLNAGEYVIPKDVVSHKGTEFFNNLIAKSRKLRTGMAGPRPGPTMKPALGGRPTFASRPLPGR